MLKITKSAYFRGESANEYTNPAKIVDDDLYKSKMLAANELDNILKSSNYNRWENDDGRHKGVIRWLYYKTIFAVKQNDNEYAVISGKISIKRIARGDCFYDITEIKNITDSNVGRNIINDIAKSEGNVSTDSISQNSENVNIKR